MIKEIKKSDIELSYSSYSFKDVKKGTAIVGQEKALSLLRLGLSTDRVGYNIFLSGDDGSGRLTAVLEEIAKIDGNTSSLKDVAYGYSISKEPYLLIFEKGKAEEFQSDLIAFGKKEMDEKDMKHKWPSLTHFLSTLPPFEKKESAYRINIVINHRESVKRPSIIETHPSAKSLFGYIDKKKENHLGIRIGSYQAASGGFLILNAEEVVGDEKLWKRIKRYLEMTHRALSSDKVKGESFGSVRPRPIPILTKIVLIGNERTYDRLMEKDEKFIRYFRISPEFDYAMKASEENIYGTVSFLKSASADFLKVEDSAFAEILRFSSWLAEERNSLSTELSRLGDLLEEANKIAFLSGKDRVEKEDVSKALDNRYYHASANEERLNEEIKNGSIVISLAGKKIGIVNGLAVIDRGTSSFGTPCVISVAVAPGNEGIVNIEHEAGLSGGIHDKGLLILEGYLRRQYAGKFPLSLYAGICFEQSYAEVDGDSASLSELYALLSAIACVPIRQDIAVTGSVSQMGDLQPVGGINEKIEGFYNACRAVGLTGKQGVIIPVQNINSLVLSKTVEKAIENGSFHLYAIEHLEDGLELMTGMECGKRNKSGDFPPSSFNRLVEDNLRSLCRYSQEKN